MLRRLTRAIVLPCVAVLGVAGCRSEKPPPIVVEERQVKVHNQTGERWSDVRVWLNDHFVAGTPELPPNGRFTVNQRDFIAAMGQRFDPSRQSPYGVLLTAKAESGEVRLVWGRPYKK
jgi:hypothetical protein